MNTYSAIHFHDAIATEFTHRYSSSEAFQERYQLWIRLFDRYVQPMDSVIDLGCGSGIFSRYLADKGCSVTGIDGSAAMIALCQQTKQSAHEHYVWQTLPFADGSTYTLQNVVLMSSFLEYVEEMDRMLEQAGDLLKPSGLLIVSMPNRTSMYRIAERILFAFTNRPKYVAYSRHSATENDFHQQVNRLGFDLLETAYFSGHDPISRLLKPFLAKRYVNSLFVGVYRKRPY